MTQSIQVQEYQSPYGTLLIASFKDELVLCDWKYRKMRVAIDQRILTGLAATFVVKTSKLIEETIRQLEEYFKNERTAFDIPIRFVGTDFQISVWQKLIEIPFGKTNSYLELSNQLGNPKAIRAVASANGANAISILIPCHRIIGSNGELTGYAGGLPAKKKLLTLENKTIGNEQFSLF
jgi:methylated-DNA-[protein]-cysteine S-methyltransferase